MKELIYDTDNYKLDEESLINFDIFNSSYEDMVCWIRYKLKLEEHTISENKDMVEKYFLGNYIIHVHTKLNKTMEESLYVSNQNGDIVFYKSNYNINGLTSNTFYKQFDNEPEQFNSYVKSIIRCEFLEQQLQPNKITKSKLIKV